MNDEDFDARVVRVAVLGDRVRRKLYRYVVAQPAAVSRDEAAEGVGVARHVAKFHLDKLEEDGLLEAEFRRPPERGGPGGGRPAKLYRRAAREVAVSLPERRYDLAGRIMAKAISDAERDMMPIADALHQAAQDAGRDLGQQARQRAGSRPSRAVLLGAVHDVLGDYGYEPRTEDAALTLANCPFRALARDYRDLVCTMNLDVMNGLLDELGPTNLRAELDPRPDRCCVKLCSRPAVA